MAEIHSTDKRSTSYTRLPSIDVDEWHIQNLSRLSNLRTRSSNLKSSAVLTLDGAAIQCQISDIVQQRIPRNDSELVCRVADTAAATSLVSRGDTSADPDLDLINLARRLQRDVRIYAVQQIVQTYLGGKVSDAVDVASGGDLCLPYAFCNAKTSSVNNDEQATLGSVNSVYPEMWQSMGSEPVGYHHEKVNDSRLVDEVRQFMSSMFPKHDFVTEDMRRLSISANSKDLCVIFGPPPNLFASGVAELTRITRPGGLIVFVNDNCMCGVPEDCLSQYKTERYGDYEEGYIDPDALGLPLRKVSVTERFRSWETLCVGKGSDMPWFFGLGFEILQKV